MPNVEANSKTSSRKKDKRKSLAVTTEKDVSPLPQETLSPITPALETGEAGLENVNKNPYIDVLNKRVRKLKKMMIKIERYETIQNSSSSDPNTQLNPDQIKVLERKSEVSGIIKEFEETLKQIEGVEKEELKKQAELKRAQQAELEQAIADSAEEAKAAHCKSLLQLILFFRLVHFQQRNITQLPDNEFESVETFRAKLTTLAEEAVNDELYEEKIRQVLDLVNKLHSGDEELIMKSLSNGVHEEVVPSGESSSSYGISYSQLRSLIQSPPILEPSGDQDETFEIIQSNPEATIQPEHVDVTTSEYSGGLQFMRSEDQSQPQTYDTTYVYQNTVDAEQIPQVVTGEVIHSTQEQYNQQQNYDIQQQHISVEQQQYVGEQQQQQVFIEQDDQQQQVSTEQVESTQQESPSVQESQIVSEDQIDSNQSQANQQNSNQPPPLSGSGGHRGGGRYRGRGHRGSQGPRRDSGGYNNNYGSYHRDGGAYGNYRGGRGGGGPGSRGGRGGGFPQGNRGTQYRPQRSQ